MKDDEIVKVTIETVNDFSMTDDAGKDIDIAKQRRGWISHEKTVWCGKCAEWYQSSNFKGFTKEIREGGWRLTRKHGWLCPECSKEKGKR